MQTQYLWLHRQQRCLNHSLAMTVMAVLILLLSFVGSLHADDTAIFGGAKVVEPNVMIIYDTSGSMKDSPSGSLWGGIFGKSKDEIASGIIEKLIKDISGVRLGLMVFNPELKWKHIIIPYVEADGGKIVAPIATLDTAHRARIAKAFDDTHDSFWDYLVSLGFTNTPLAESLSEAGLYFAGKESWAKPKSGVPSDVWGSDKVYKSPVQFRCQQNYVIILTDGMASDDSGDVLTRSDYMYGKSIGDFDGDKVEPGNNAHYLDDVAKFLFDTDILQGGNEPAGKKLSFDSSDFPIQNIITYTIGFDVSEFPDATNLLRRTADIDHGNGRFFSTDSAEGLYNSFKTILDIIYNGAYNYSATAVPIAGDSQYFSGNTVYVPMFVPSTTGSWSGNLRKYAVGHLLNSDGKTRSDAVLVDVKAKTALNESTGLFNVAAKDFWSNNSDDADYSKVKIGGVGSVLKTAGQRKLWIQLDRSKSDLALVNTTSGITKEHLGLSDDANMNKLINYINGTTQRDWVLGDIIHSIPSVMNVPSSPKLQTAVFVGANDGFIHCFLDTHTIADTWSDANKNGCIDSGETLTGANQQIEEVWAFAPNELLGTFKYLHPDLRDSNAPPHSYYVDGSPLIYSLKSTNAYTLAEARNPDAYDDIARLVFGLRRGGVSTTILSFLAAGDIRKTSSSKPALADKPGSIKTINNSTLSALGTTPGLGQSWSKAQLGIVAASDPSYKKVLFLGGGYDAAEDNIVATADNSNRRKGSFAYAVDALTGVLFDEFSEAGMLASIVDLAVFDRGNDRIDDTFYAPDLGGKIWRFSADDAWDGGCVFDGTVDATCPRKFFSAPDVVLEPGYEYIFIGSGDREHPRNVNVGTTENATAGYDRFYGLKFRTKLADADAESSDKNYPITEAKLTNITSAQFNPKTGSLHGWFICLTAQGEKVINRAVTVKGTVFFTTYQPIDADDLASDVDLCSPNVQGGVARLYAINYETGNYVYNWFADDKDPVYAKDSLADKRSLVLGQPGLPAQPSLVITDKGLSLVVGSRAIPLNIPAVATTYYWRYLD